MLGSGSCRENSRNHCGLLTSTGFCFTSFLALPIPFHYKRLSQKHSNHLFWNAQLQKTFAVSPNRKYKHFSIGTNGEPKTALQQGGLAREQRVEDCATESVPRTDGCRSCALGPGCPQPAASPAHKKIC